MARTENPMWPVWFLAFITVVVLAFAAFNVALERKEA